MPNKDGSGPLGQGPQTGRKAGRCSENVENTSSPEVVEVSVGNSMGCRRRAGAGGGCGVGFENGQGRGNGMGRGRGAGKGQGRGRGCQ